MCCNHLQKGHLMTVSVIVAGAKCEMQFTACINTQPDNNKQSPTRGADESNKDVRRGPSRCCTECRFMSGNNSRLMFYLSLQFIPDAVNGLRVTARTYSPETASTVTREETGSL